MKSPRDVPHRVIHKALEFSVQEFGFVPPHLQYGRVSFRDGSFYGDSLLRPLSSRTEHSRLVMRHCRNSSVISVLSALLTLFRCACVSSFFYFSAFLLSWLWFFHPWRPSKWQKRRKNQTADVTFFLDVFWTTAWAFFNKIKVIWLIFFQLSV